MDRRDFLRVALAGGAVALIPKALLAGKPTDEGSTNIYIEGARVGDEIVIWRVLPGEKTGSAGTSVRKTMEVYREEVTDEDLDHWLPKHGPPVKGTRIVAPLKWGEIRVHLIQRTESNFSIVGPDDKPMGVQILTSRTTEVEHGRMPDGKPTKRKNMISINGLETELDDKWDIVMPDDPLAPDRGYVQLQFTDPKHLLPPGAKFTGVDP